MPIINEDRIIRRKRNKKYSEILSASPVKARLEEKREKQIKKKIRKENQPLTKKKLKGSQERIRMLSPLRIKWII